MTGLWPKLGVLLAASFALADELPLPKSAREPSGLQIPSAVIRPPVSDPIVVPMMREPVVKDEETILGLERRLIEEQVRRQIAEAYATGNASKLKQIIVMSGPVDAAVSRAAKPPFALDTPVALIGLEKDAVVGKSLEQFFGAPMTPDREKSLLDVVKDQLAGKDKPKVDVHIAGWWPDEGVMAVSVMPKGS